MGARPDENVKILVRMPSAGGKYVVIDPGLFDR